MVLQLCILAVLLLLWAAASRYKWTNPVLISSPSEVWDFLVKSFRSGEMSKNFWATMKAVIFAFAIGSTTGTVVGMILGLAPTLNRVVSPYVNGFNSMPRIALAPLFLVYFGITTTAKVAMATSFIFFVGLESAYAGVQAVDADLVTLFRSLSSTRFQLFRKLLLPFAVPNLFAGMRLSLIYSLLGVVASEILAARAGLGQMVQEYSSTFDMAGVYGVLIVLAVTATIINTAMKMVERRLSRWQE